MAIKNNRKSILTNSEDRLKNKLKENYRRFLKEEDEESADSDFGGEVDANPTADAEGADAGLDADPTAEGPDAGADASVDGDELADEVTDDVELTDEQAETVDSWVDELLGDSLEAAEISDDESLDAETPAGEIDPMGEDQTIHDDLPLTVDELNNIIDSDDSLHALEDALNGLAIDQTDDESGLDGIDGLDGLEDDQPLEDEELEESSRQWQRAHGNLRIAEGEGEEAEGEELEEGIGDMVKAGVNKVKGVAQKAKKFYDDEVSPNSVKPGGKYHGKHATLASNLPEAEEAEGEEINEAELEEGLGDAINKGVQAVKGVAQKAKKFYDDEISPNSVKPGGKYHGKHATLASNLPEAEELDEAELAAAIKELGFVEPKEGLNDKITSTVSNTGITGGAKSNVEEVNESIKKSKMLVTSAAVIAKLQESVTSQKSEIAALKLENYKLIKANGLLSVAGDKLSKEARTKISESFDACKSVKQVDAFYTKLAESIKQINRPSLNEAVSSNKTRIQVIKESAQPAEDKKPLKESVSREQNRINYLMGYGSNDAYFDF